MTLKDQRQPLVRKGQFPAILVTLVLLSVAGGTVLLFIHRSTPTANSRRLPRRVVVSNRVPQIGLEKAPQSLPDAEPLSLLALSPDQARAFNAGIPYARGPNPAAASFAFAGTPEDREKATTCLASAVLYEAGDDRAGEEAVAQVVLNRLRHPAYPKTVCGVVFQGSERDSGCQFTFACDGSLARVPAPAAWKRARVVATAALNGYVSKPVGMATHYHADWVVPYWYKTLDKVTSVHTQIFYRWRGWWGRPIAFTRNYSPPEQMDPRIAMLANASEMTNVPGTHADDFGAGLTDGSPAQGLASPPIGTIPKGTYVRLADAASGTYVLQLDPAAFPGSYAVFAYGLCKMKSQCLVLGWLRPDQVPQALPLRLGQQALASFIYEQSGPLGEAHVRWDCRAIRRADVAQCIKGTAQRLPAASEIPAQPAMKRIPSSPAADTPDPATARSKGARED